MVMILYYSFLAWLVIHFCTPKAKRQTDGAGLERCFWALACGGLVFFLQLAARPVGSHQQDREPSRADRMVEEKLAGDLTRKR